MHAHVLELVPSISMSSYKAQQVFCATFRPEHCLNVCIVATGLFERAKAIFTACIPDSMMKMFMIKLAVAQKSEIVGCLLISSKRIPERGILSFACRACEIRGLITGAYLTSPNEVSRKLELITVSFFR
jgi:hypothetical protein